MATTVRKAIEDMVELYNQARTSENKDKAVRLGKQTVDMVNGELAKTGISAANRAYYLEVKKGIEAYLAGAQSNSALASKLGDAVENKIQTTDWFSAPVPNVTLSDIAGLQEVRDEFIVNVFAPLTPKYAPIYKKYRGEEKGVQILLYGPGGTGKTFAVRCLGGSLNCKIAVVQTKDVMANLVGDGAKIIAEIFEQASKYDRSIIFFDEIDAIAASREDDESRHTKEQLTTLLTYMDGFTSNVKPGQIRIVIAATNRPWILDSALKRGGRFDTQIYVPLPDVEARREMIAVALGKDKNCKNGVKIPCADDVTLDWLVEKFDGYSGADIKAVCRQAGGRALRREIMAARDGAPKDDCVRRSDFEETLEKYINPITDEALMQYDAYRHNMQFDMEYARWKCEDIALNLYNNYRIEKHELRWFKTYYENGYVWKWLHAKYDVSYIPEKLSALLGTTVAEYKPSAFENGAF